MAICKHCGAEIENGLEYCPDCGQKTDEFGTFFEPDAALEKEMYNIFDTPEEFDMDSLLSKEFAFEELAGATVAAPASTPDEADVLTAEISDFAGLDEADESTVKPDFQILDESTVEMPDFVGLDELDASAADPSELSALNEADATDFLSLDELLKNMDEDEKSVAVKDEPEFENRGLEELLAAGNVDEPEEKKKEKVKKKEKKSVFQMLFGNVPVDESKLKPELTPEEIAQKKAKVEEEKKAKAEGKKLAAEEKKQLAKKNKQEKARQKSLAKEEKKAKKLQEAKQILEEMKETRINRLGATIVFSFFAVCAVVILSGSELFGYTVSIGSAEANFNKAYNNNVKYYTDAYNAIYGLEIRSEDQMLSDKIMTVMFVNKELNSYNSYMSMKDYTSALHSLLLGMYRYGKYYEQAIPLGVDKDMDYVRTQILRELEITYGISEDEAEVLRGMLEQAGTGGLTSRLGTKVYAINPEEAGKYNQKLNEIVEKAKKEGKLEE